MTSVAPVLPRLGRALLDSGALAGVDGLGVPTPEVLSLPERAVQFGTGAFLRGFVDAILDDANRRGAFGGCVVAVASTESGRGDAINTQDGLYTLVTRGLGDSGPEAEARVVGSVSRVLAAATEWDAVLACARSPELRLVFSNTTEVGIVLDGFDRADSAPPLSFPGKLTRFLYERARAFDFDPSRGVVVLPCELIGDNGERLLEIVTALARRWRLGADFERWLGVAVPFCNTLVDRIVPGAPSEAELSEMEQRLGYHDPMLTVAEVYRLFAIEGDAALGERIGFALSDPTVVVARDIAPYRERKVRLLNGTHTIAAPLALLCGCTTVGEAMGHDLVGPFIRTVLLDELVPVVDSPGAGTFAHDVLRRFANPFLHHALIDITLQGTAKMRLRVLPSVAAWAHRAGRVPPSLALGFAAYLWYMRGDFAGARAHSGLSSPADDEGGCVRAHWARSEEHGSEPRELVEQVGRDRSLWGADLTELPGFTAAVAAHLARIASAGTEGALAAHLGAASACA